MDSNKYSVLLVSLEASATEGAYLTNAGYPITYEGNTYQNADGLKVKLPVLGGTIDKEECRIEGMAISEGFLSNLANHYPYSKIDVTVKELDINIDSETVAATRTLFTGMIYQVMPAPLTGYMSIAAKGWKYYTDIVAGLPCTEQCAWSILGGIGCGATVVEEAHTVASVSGYDLTISSSLSNTTAFLFNKGYVELGGARIKIKYHESGNTFQMDKAPPSDWVGQTVTMYSGCDRRLATCRDIYDNENNFMGMGIAMVDYNPFYENP